MKRASALIFCCIFACLLASASVVQAGGFQLFEYGTRAIGMGTANYAVGNDASVIAYNPALMTQFTEPQALAGVAAIAPSSDVNITSSTGAGAVGGYKTKEQTFFVPHAYYVQPVNEDVTLGAGLFTRFGLGTKYDEDWGGATMLQDIVLESVSFNPTAAFKFNEKLSFAVGVELIKGSMLMKKAFPAAAGGGQAKLDVDGISVGGNFAAAYQFDDAWNMGFHYRSPIKFTGDGDFDKGSNANPGFSNGGVTISATFPSSYSLGLGYKPSDDWTFEASTIFTRWELFDEMKFDYEASTGMTDNDEKFYYKNTWRFQLGAEYMALDWLALRAGYAYDQTPTRHDYASPMLPANDRNLFSLGVGFLGENWFCDIAGMYVTTKARSNMSKTVTADGTYTYDFKNGKTGILSASFGYNF